MVGKLTRRRIVIASAAVLGLAAAGLFVAATMASPSLRLVHSALRTTYTSPASYTQVVERRLGNPRREEFRVWQAGLRRKVVQISPAPLAGLTFFRDGLAESAFLPGFPYALEARFQPDFRHEVVPPPRLPRPRLHPRRVTVNSETLPGRGPVRVLTVRAGGVVQVRFWTDPRSGFILRQERYAPDGQPFDVTENRDLVLSPLGLAEALRMDFPPATTRLADARRWWSEFVVFALTKEAPFPFLLPRRLPRGISLVHGESLHAAETEVVALRFDRGRAGFSLFEYPASIPGIPPDALMVAPRGRLGPAHMFRTVREGLALVAVGRLTEGEFREVTAALEWISPESEQDKADGGRTETK